METLANTRLPDSAPSQVLFVDAYDSFTNNIVSLLETKLGLRVTVIKHDTAIEDIASLLKPFAAVVLGPGPGDPRFEKDIGLFRRFWRLDDEQAIPILGICLGFQSLVLAFGGHIERLPEPRHGLIRSIRHDGRDIFQGLNLLIQSVQYHSLHATLGDQKPWVGDSFNGRSDTLFPSSTDLVALAWDYHADNTNIDAHVSSINPKSILMAVRHKRMPYHGLQFHPESICSSSSAQKILVNWWHNVQEWWIDQPARPTHQCHDAKYQRGNSHTWPVTQLNDQPSIKFAKVTDGTKPVSAKVIPSIDLTIPEICSRLGLEGDRVVVLDSENHQRADVGQHSIVGLISPESLRFEYCIGAMHIREIYHGQTTIIDLKKSHLSDVFGFLKDFIRQRSAQSAHISVPFWGGLIGYINYESGLETINVPPKSAQNKDTGRPLAPDLSFVFVERSIVVAHIERNIYIQTLLPNDDTWVDTTASLLKIDLPPSPPTSPFSFFDANITLPCEATYKANIRAAQSHIRAGDSYELCLTSHASIHTPRQLPSWPLYLRLRQLNPAPFGAYLCLGGVTLLSSSPERFLSWTRPTERREGSVTNSICQFRPIKGTIARQPDPESRPLTLEQAKALLATPKEQAENLMIVDLIRHDLHGVVGSGNVGVPKLMVVEEYKTLFQLVSVIEGNLHVPEDPQNEDVDRNCVAPCHKGEACDEVATRPLNTRLENKTGIDVLAASIPPGSMTGAPKLRSCQLLQGLEGKPRGVYSGVIGYLDVGGRGDFSVVIRSAVRWNGGHADSSTFNDAGGGLNEVGLSDPNHEITSTGCNYTQSEKGDTWTIGAGGAITALSTEEGEHEEMLMKLKSTLRLFEDETTTYQ